MCCVITSLLKIVLIFISVGILFVVNFQMLRDLNLLCKGGLAKQPETYYTFWSYYCWGGTLLPVLRLKDLCYLHWWILLTAVDIIGGFVITFMQRESEDFGTRQKLSNYFVLEHMLITLFTVASYTATLRAQQDE